jgi:uncharacterized damage-inducible protein DinB
MRARLHHAALVQRLFLQLWRGETLAQTRVEDYATLEEMQAWARSFHDEALHTLDGWSMGALGREMSFPWAARLTERFGPVHPATVGDSIVQIAMHSTHHRGQVLADLRALGAEPPLTDFIAWTWQGRPAARWTEPAAA